MGRYEKENANQAAKRQIVKYSSFTRLINKGACAVEKNTLGDTKHSVISIKAAAEHYKAQTKDLANALKGNTLQQTVANIYHFLYTHFQYEADSELQKLRSPECSFADRFKGIDCKSFTLLASTILLNLNIKHLIRRIKQPRYKPSHWSHVYVVVCQDQNKGDLTKGYYVIDGTIHKNKETPYIKKHDVQMGYDLPHVWLNGPESQEPKINTQEKYQKLLNLLARHGFSGTFIENVYRLINTNLSQGIYPEIEIGSGYIAVGNQKVNLTYGLNGESTGGAPEDQEDDGGDWSWLTDIDWGGIFQGTDCWGGSAYDGNVANGDRENIKKLFRGLVIAINEAVQAKNLPALTLATTNFFGISQVAYKAYGIKIGEGWNSCTTKNLQNTRQFLLFYTTKVTKALTAYLEEYFNIATNGNKEFNSFIVDSLWGGYIRPLAKVNVPQNNYSIKNGITSIPAFEVTEYAANTSDAAFNAFDYIKTLTNNIIDSQGGIDLNGNGTPTTAGNTPTTGGSNSGGQPPKQKAGMGLVSVIAITGIGLGFLLTPKNKVKTNIKPESVV